MKVAIRPVRLDDAQAFVEASLRSRSLHHPWVAPPCDEAAFAAYVARFVPPAHLGFVAHDAASGALLGAINLTNIVFGVFRSGYLGYFAFAGHEGRGLMKAGLKLVVRHAFRDLGLHRVEAN